MKRGLVATSIIIALIAGGAAFAHDATRNLTIAQTKPSPTPSPTSKPLVLPSPVPTQTPKCSGYPGGCCSGPTCPTQCRC